jgi:hypothetical protein
VSSDEKIVLIISSSCQNSTFMYCAGNKSLDPCESAAVFLHGQCSCTNRVRNRVLLFSCDVRTRNITNFACTKSFERFSCDDALLHFIKQHIHI